MKKFLLASVLAVACGSVAQANPRPLFPRLHQRMASHRGTPCRDALSFRSSAPTISYAVTHPVQFVADVVRPIPDHIRSLMVLPGSAGGCGPNGCPRLPAGLPR